MNIIRKYKLYKLFDVSDLKEFFIRWELYFNSLNTTLKQSQIFYNKILVKEINYSDEFNSIFTYWINEKIIFIHNITKIRNLISIKLDKIEEKQFIEYYFKTQLKLDFNKLHII